MNQFFLDPALVPRGKWFSRIDAMQTYVDALRNDQLEAWAKAHPSRVGDGSRSRIRVVDKRGYRAIAGHMLEDSALTFRLEHWGVAFIYLPTDFRWEVVLLHEVAHTVHPGHDEGWWSLWLELVAQQMGKTAASKLILAVSTGPADRPAVYDVALCVELQYRVVYAMTTSIDRAS